MPLCHDNNLSNLFTNVAVKSGFQDWKNAVGEQQGYLLVKVIGRNTEKTETFLLTTTEKTFDYTILYRLEIKLDLWILIQMIRCYAVIFSLIHSVQFRDNHVPRFPFMTNIIQIIPVKGKHFFLNKFLSAKNWKIVTIANR